MAKWREFEELVERLEQHSLPPGAIIKSPDRVKCKITGKLREVDVSIQLPIEHGSKLVTIECRDRADIEDVTWIEQLITKRRNIGAAITIAISSQGFTSTAIQMAANDGILLRGVEEITDEEIESWMGKIRVRSGYVVKIPISIQLFNIIGERQKRGHSTFSADRKSK